MIGSLTEAARANFLRTGRALIALQRRVAPAPKSRTEIRSSLQHLKRCRRTPPLAPFPFPRRSSKPADREALLLVALADQAGVNGETFADNPQPAHHSGSIAGVQVAQKRHLAPDLVDFEERVYWSRRMIGQNVTGGCSADQPDAARREKKCPRKRGPYARCHRMSRKCSQIIELEPTPKEESV